MRRSFLAIIFLLFIPIFTLAQEIPAPNDGFLHDFAGQCLLSEAQDLSNTLSSIEERTTVEIAVVTMQNCGDSPFDFRVRLFEQWGIGKEGVDNGLLILACLDQGTLEQEVGFGLEGVLPDLLTYQAAEEAYAPALETGVCQGLQALVNHYDPILTESDEVQAEDEGDPTVAIIGIVIFFVVWLGGGLLLAAIDPDLGRLWFEVGLRVLVAAASSGGKSGGYGGGRSGGGGSSFR